MAEAIGAWKGLQHTIKLQPSISQRRIWLCIDSTSVIWCLRGDASNSSQWAFHNCQGVMQTHNVSVKWAPGHTGIEGNEAADKLADLGASTPQWDAGLASEPTVSGIRTVFRQLRREAQCLWWAECSTKLSKWYKNWALTYQVTTPPELELPRSILHRLLAIRSSHGDFEWYHTKFKHTNAKLTCSCGHRKGPIHLVRCRKTAKNYRKWPQKPRFAPTNSTEAINYLSSLMASPTDFEALLETTGFYTRICTR